MSDDGQILYGVDNNLKKLWKSSNAGVVFADLPNSYLQGDGGVYTAILSIAGSSNGQNLVIGQAIGGYVWTSANGGTSFTRCATVAYDTTDFGR